MKLQDRLILNKYILSLFGVKKLAAADNPQLFEQNLRDVLLNAREGFNEEGKSYFLESLLSSNLELDKELFNKLEDYDRNIKEYLDHINLKRDNPIVFKYFQYLAVLFTEIFLDRYFKQRKKFLAELNRFVNEENQQIKKAKERYSHFTEKDLHKLAYYMATGSGKTLIMHINYLQYLRYSDRELDNVILVTPNSGLSKQHLEEFKKSNIEADYLLNVQGGLFKEDKVYIIEITKLVETKEGEGDSIEISWLEGHNLVLVDEGHKGSGGDVWKENRELLARDGFIFEYSATFGQAVGNRVDCSEKWKNDAEYVNNRVKELSLPEEIADDIFNVNKHHTYINMSLYQLEEKMQEYNLDTLQQEKIKGLYNNLLEEYSKSIIFDYSYKYFYEDGYGKDYSILNLKEAQLKEYNDNFLLANLLSFYEQKLYYQENEEKIRAYNLENPLLLFVGHTVSASGSLTSDDKASISDLEFVIQFLNKFLSEKAAMINTINNILNNKSGFIDEDGRDIFADKFPYLKGKEQDGTEIYAGILKAIFNTSAGLSHVLELYEIKNVQGEIGLKIKGSADYFGLINIGDVSRLSKRLEKASINLLEDNFADSFFTRINDRDSKINILIGSRKFTEGWNSYRVSNIGLLNIGRSEGSQIIQLFGRGVRLRGLNNSLQRSSVFTERKHPEYIELLETLNIFGIKADYMDKFREYLEKEGIETAGYEEIKLPVKRNTEFLKKDLLTLKVNDQVNFKEDKLIELEVDKDIIVKLDLRPKMEQLMSFNSKKDNDVVNDEEPQIIKTKYLDYLNWDQLYLEMVSYKKQRQFSNLLLKKETLKSILENRLYTLYCNPEDITVRIFADFSKLEDTVSKILKKYIAKFYKNRRLAYENKHLEYTPLSKEDSNFQDYVLKVDKRKKELIKEIKELIDRQDEIYDERLEEIEAIPNVYFDRHLFQPLLVQGKQIKSTPVGLNKDERYFIEKLREYFLGAKEKELLKDKEIFVLRNLTRGKGVGFFEANNFYPDFILWVKDDEKQYINFVDPKGIRNLHHLEHPKIKLHQTIKDIEKELSDSRDKLIILNSFIISNTRFEELRREFKEDRREEFEKRNVLFNDDEDLIAKLFTKICLINI